MKKTVILSKTDQFIIAVALQDYYDKVSNKTIMNTEDIAETTLSNVERIFDHERFEETEITLTVTVK